VAADRTPVTPGLSRRSARHRRGPLRGLLLLLLGLAAALGLHAWDRLRMQQRAAELGPRAEAAVQALVPLLQDLAHAPDGERLERINRFVNQRIAYTEDAALWGEPDHWASPLVALAQGRGDCEDYSIAKYFALTAAGVPPVALRLVYARAREPSAPRGYVAHMVLAYYPRPGAVPLILDNRVPQVQPASMRGDLTPVFSFNAEGLWEGAGPVGAGDPVVRLSRWRQVLAGAHEEGFW